MSFDLANLKGVDNFEVLSTNVAAKHSLQMLMIQKSLICHPGSNVGEPMQPEYRNAGIEDLGTQMAAEQISCCQIWNCSKWVHTHQISVKIR